VSIHELLRSPDCSLSSLELDSEFFRHGGRQVQSTSADCAMVHEQGVAAASERDQFSSSLK